VALGAWLLPRQLAAGKGLSRNWGGVKFATMTAEERPLESGSENAGTDLLKEVPLFNLLDDQERAELAGRLDLIRFAAGESIFNYGDPGDAIYVISSGEAEVFYRNDTGERIVLEVARRGDFFGELSMLDNGARTASVVALKDTTALRLDRTDLEKFLELRPLAAMDLLAAMGRRQRANVERLRHTATRNVNEESEDKRSLVQKAADGIAEFSGSIPFLIIHVVGFGLWVGVNWIPIPGFKPFDPYPFGFLTLAVSLEAIFLSVFVLLSQNRQAAKDRIHADIEYDINLKAELEIAHLHEKIDRLTGDVLGRLERIYKAMPKSAEAETETRRLFNLEQKK
jgi:CRP/FNR family cyclic AMP-dependent transcriptional regulator